MNILKKLYWCLFVWRIPFSPDEGLNDVDVFVTQAVWRLKSGQPGPGNELLADAIERIHTQYPKKPILAQDILADVLGSRGISCEWIKKSEHELYVNSSLAWNTSDVSKQQFEICGRRGWRTIGIVAMPDHVVRSYLTYVRAGFNDIRVVAVDGVQIHYHHPNNLYWSMRGRRWRFLLRELFCKLFFLATKRI